MPAKPHNSATQRLIRNFSRRITTLISAAKIGAVKARAVTRAIGVSVRAVKNMNMAITFSTARSICMGNRCV